MAKTYNWGIIGLGHIAHKFAHDLLLSNRATLYGVASRSLQKAAEFGKKYKANLYFSSYEELINDSSIDVIYIATPHVFHKDITLKCLEAGKVVLCEKAFGMNYEEVEEMVKKAKQKNIFLMEAFWTRFIPATEKLLEILESGIIGKIQTVKADFGFKADYNPKKRLYNKKLGGGSLLDIGIYPVFLSLLTIGVPDKIKAAAVMSDTGIDSSCGMVFSYETGELAVLDSTLNAETAMDAWIYGDLGALRMHRRFHHSKKISLYVDNEIVESYDINYKGNGYYHEILEVMSCLDEGKTESSKMPLSMSLNLIETLDRVREEIGLEY